MTFHILHNIHAFIEAKNNDLTILYLKQSDVSERKHVRNIWIS